MENLKIFSAFRTRCNTPSLFIWIVFDFHTPLQITAVMWTMSIFFGILPWLTLYRLGNRVKSGSFPRSQRWLIWLLVDLLTLKPFYRSRPNTRQNRCVNLLKSPSFLILGDKTPSSVMLPHCEDCNLSFYRLHALKGLHLQMMALLLSALTRIGMLTSLSIWTILSVFLFTRQHKLVAVASSPWYDSIIVWEFRQDWLNESTGADGAFFARTSKCIRNLFFGNQMTVLEAFRSWKRSVHLSLPISVPFVPSSSTGTLRRCVH